MHIPTFIDVMESWNEDLLFSRLVDLYRDYHTRIFLAAHVAYYVSEVAQECKSL